MGLAAGLMRIWVPFVFLVAGTLFAAGLGELVGSGVFGFIESEARQELAGFFLIFAATLVVGAVIALALLVPLSIASALMSLVPMGGMVNRAGGLALGTLTGLIVVSVILIGLQQYPVASVGRAIAESSVASAPIGWVDRFVASIEISPEWKDQD